MVVLSKSPSLSPAALRRTNSSLLSKLAISPNFAKTFGYLKRSDDSPSNNSSPPSLSLDDTPSDIEPRDPNLLHDSRDISGQSTPNDDSVHIKYSSEEDEKSSISGKEENVVAVKSSDNSASTLPDKKRRERRPYVANLGFPLRLLGTIYTGLCISCGLVLVYLAQMITKLACYPFTDAHHRSLICARILDVVSYFTTTVLNPLWSVKILTPIPKLVTHADKSKPPKCIFVINHLSNADPWICSGAGIPSESAWICKGDLFKIPIGGWTLANSGHLKVEFTKEKGGWGTKKGAIAKMMEQATDYIESGRAIVVYPEGVRNPNPEGPIGEFKLGFFNLAVKTDAFIIPVAMSGSEKMWPVGESLFDSSTAFVSYGEPISAKGETPESLRDKTHKIISDMRDKHPDRLPLF